MWRAFGLRLLEVVPLQLDEALHEETLQRFAPSITEEPSERLAPAHHPAACVLLREMARAPTRHEVARSVASLGGFNPACEPSIERFYRALLLEVADRLTDGGSR